nr:uncharacterized protein LOC123763254 [Procambarus clarkii]
MLQMYLKELNAIKDDTESLTINVSSSETCTHFSAITEPWSFIPGTGRVPGTRKVEAPAALSVKCYRYRELRATNTCCRMVDYARDNGSNILECATRSGPGNVGTQRLSSSSLSEAAGTPTVATLTEEALHVKAEGAGGQHWVFLGDSHIRNVFEILVKRIAGPRVKYRLNSFEKDEWRDVELIFEKGWNMYHETIDVVHLDVPLRLTFYWDIHHAQLPHLLHQWLGPPQRTPSLLLVGDSVTHWIVESWDEKILSSLIFFDEYQQQLRNFSRQLSRLARHTAVIFKLQDHVPLGEWFRHNNVVTDQFNSLAREWLSGSGVLVWDSTLPLANQYVQQCIKHHRQTPDNTWKCNDVYHVGYIVIEQYADMLMNYICNRFLGVGDKYCLS